MFPLAAGGTLASRLSATRMCGLTMKHSKSLFAEKKATTTYGEAFFTVLNAPQIHTGRTFTQAPVTQPPSQHRTTVGGA